MAAKAIITTQTLPSNCQCHETLLLDEFEARISFACSTNRLLIQTSNNHRPPVIINQCLHRAVTIQRTKKYTIDSLVIYHSIVHPSRIDSLLRIMRDCSSPAPLANLETLDTNLPLEGRTCIPRQYTLTYTDRSRLWPLHLTSFQSVVGTSSSRMDWN